ncbi:MAG TPA: anti-sigma factor [Pseudonocardia sp.]|nr:anti-sigma factor [Pseudonocardia sp.]
MNATRFCPRTPEAVGLALHALEPDEEMAMLLHLPQCTVCRTAVHDVEQVLGGLGSAVEQMEPPPALRSRIVAAAEEDGQEQGVLRPRVSPEGAPTPAPAAPQPGPTPPPRHRRDGRPVERPRRSGRLSKRGGRVLAASLALVGVLAIGGLAAYTLQVEQERDAAITQAQSVAEMMSELDEPGTSHAVLATEEGTPVGAVLVSEEQRRLVTVGLPANEVDREIYVLWGIRGGTPVPIGTFDVGPAAPGPGTLRSPAEASGFSAYAISLEPGRSAPPTPTHQVAHGQVAA